jgi:hypothetical protein
MMNCYQVSMQFALYLATSYPGIIDPHNAKQEL